MINLQAEVLQQTVICTFSIVVCWMIASSQHIKCISSSDFLLKSLFQIKHKETDKVNHNIGKNDMLSTYALHFEFDD